jgi:hypothetical protein
MDNGKVKIHGKEYETVASRVKRFLEAKTAWSIETEVHRVDDKSVVMKATIRDETHRVRATGHAEEWRESSQINETSMVENAETSAVGRALAFLGYAGTEIASADEIDIANRKAGTLHDKPFSHPQTLQGGNGKSSMQHNYPEFSGRKSNGDRPVTEKQYSLLWGRLYDWLRTAHIPNNLWADLTKTYIAQTVPHHPIAQLTQEDLHALIDAEDAKSRFLNFVNQYQEPITHG